MKRVTLFALFLVILVGVVFAQTSVPNTFSAGGSISAAEMNANFKALVDAVNAQAATINTLQTQLAAKGNALPLGSVMATYVAPDANGNYMTGSTEWAFADGTVPTDAVAGYTGQFPDMRGQFVRGVNANRSDGNEAPDFGARTGGDLNKAASFEDDAFQGHWHNLYVYPNDGAPSSNSNDIRAAYTAAGNYVREAISDGVHGTPRVSSETRPSNIAVYWYIKVR